MITKQKAWISAFRLHTLPLALCCILLGNAIALAEGKFNIAIFILAFLTAILLQVLSNVANDYGDFKNGADNDKRVGPARMTHQKIISEKEMKGGIYALVFFSLISGISLILVSIPIIGMATAIVLFVIGLMSIAAAIAYTATSKPYGYSGWGDVSVFLFFGIVGVFGSYYLQTGLFNSYILMPAAGLGFLCAGVLNVNNIRDFESDKDAGKKTIAVRAGLGIAKMYHWSLILSALILFVAFGYIKYTHVYQYVFLLPAILLIINGIRVSKSKHAKEVMPLLKQLVISTLLFTISYIASLML